ALYHNTKGDFNTADGSQALFSNTMGHPNTATGYQALYSNMTGSFNTATGFQALYFNIVGAANTAIGNGALASSNGSGNTALGFFAGSNVTNANNVICIGASVSGENVSNSCYIGNVHDSMANGRAVYVNSDNKLGTLSSSRRYKDKIRPMEKASEAILSLRPVSF